MVRLSFILILTVFALSSFSQEVTVGDGRFFRVYDLRTQCPRQIEWTITPSDLGDAVREPSWTFVQDLRHPMATGTHRDYFHSGYDRGHMCPAQDRSSDLRSMRRTFVLSNIAPQAPALNRGAWKKTEIQCRYAALLYDSVQVLAVPIFLHRDTTFIGSHRLAVPHAFFKVAWLPKNDSIIGTWFFFNK